MSLIYFKEHRKLDLYEKIEVVNITITTSENLNESNEEMQSSYQINFIPMKKEF